MADYVHDAALRQRVGNNLIQFRPREFDASSLKRAAVALCVIPDDEGQAALLLTRRVTTMRAHSGQWAFPGGRLDEGETVEAAALREMAEEIGLHLEPEALLGVLDDYPTRSGYLITPVVAWADGSAELRRNPAEVASIHHISFRELDHPDTPRFYSIPESDRPVVTVPYQGQQIHAPTAAMLYQFREVALHGRATRVDELEQPVWAWR